VELKLVESVWQEYSRFTPAQLVRMTHEEPPWKEARGGLPPEAKSQNKLSHETMSRFFREQAAKRGRQAIPLRYPVIDPIMAWQAEDEFERLGRETVDAADVFGELLMEAGK
jgi:hypothetical protein